MITKQERDALLNVLSDESKWMQGAYARDCLGRHVSSEFDEACRWCLVGAMWKIRKCGPFGDGDRLFRVVRAVIESRHGMEVTVWNDTPGRTYADVRALIESLPVAD